MRTFGSSVMDVSAQVNQNIVKDIMGHARQGVTSRSYQKRKLVVGEVATLAQMLEVIERYLPVVTLSVPAASLMLLPTTQRSRCGSSRPRKIRQARV